MASAIRLSIFTCTYTNYQTLNESLKMKGKIQLALILSLTLGLAPFFPEPHIWGKIKWLLGGAEGMGKMDYFDLVLHGFPWLFLLYAIIERLMKSPQKK